MQVIILCRLFYFFFQVTALDIIRINTDRRAQLARVESIAFDSSKRNLVLRCRLLFRGLEMRNHQQYHHITPVREQIFISDAIESITLDDVVRKMPQIQQYTGQYLYSSHSATAFAEPSGRFIRDASTLPAHCSEGQQQRDRPTGVPVLPLYIHLYFDGFGLYRRKYHSTNGMYFSLGNLPRSEGAKREHMGIIGLGEPGTSFQQCMDAISPYIEKLQEGYYADCPYYGGEVFVCGGIGEINADMPQANHCANCLSSTANKRCRFCTVDKADLSNPQVASEAPRRTKANTNNIIAAMSEMGVVERKQHETETGTLYSPNNQLFSDGIVIEPHIQTRIDHFHLDALGVGRLQISLIWGNVKTQVQQFLSDLIVAIDRPHLAQADMEGRGGKPANIHCGYHTGEQIDVLGNHMNGYCNSYERYHNRIKDMGN
ncbi:uncharacterized protein LOC125898563 [Epinephelus fuscoguttatus]|uniref:uncharacterized protein LOC125898563 n=1 Tax=Epinephelus fuscoguttatus TaxID=293821 RepID=UPI0020D0C609|nr:uncharacterized protein LOC125898563 [Epinephelus fuscoguttatus]